jgi:D-serine deaminase-like pyridoxal phosphate-dependent protein
MADVAQQSGRGSVFAVPDEVDTPALLLDLDIMLRNLREMAAVCRAAGTELFPHAKAHRTVELARLQVENGAAGLAAATLDEAEAFVRGGVQDIILAYPLVGEAKIHRIEALSRLARVCVGTDSVDGARAIGRHFARLGRELDVLLIVDSGLHRVGVAPELAAPIAREINAISGVRLGGVMTHEGSVYRAETPEELKAFSEEAAALMVNAAEAIRAAGIPIETVSMGSSAAAREVAGLPGVTQVRPGIYAFNDLGQVSLGNATFDSCAVRVLATVISHPTRGRACIDAGSKALSRDLPVAHIGATQFPGYGYIVDAPGWQIHQLSEEHGWLRWSSSGEPTPLAIGQRVQVIPNHICVVFSSLGETIALREGAVEGVWRAIPRTAVAH